MRETYAAFMSAAGIFEAVDRSDVAVIQRGKDFCFSPEPRHALSIPREFLGLDLDGNVAPEF